jgi:hypothetical protein
MALLRKIFGRHQQEAAMEVPCPHTALVPRWAKSEDMRKPGLATAYFCMGCGLTISPEEAKASAPAFQLRA